MAMKYWVNIDGIQQGPITRNELAELDFDPEVTYIWHQNLDDWQRIDTLPDLTDIVAAKQALKASTPQAEVPAAEVPIAEVPVANPSVAEVPAAEVKPEETPAPQAEVPAAEVPIAEVPVANPSVAEAPAAEVKPEGGIATPPPLYAKCPPISMPQPQYFPPQQPLPDPEKEASTHLIWAIIVTLICCQITGIIAIVYGALASHANSQCNYERAHKLSDTAQVWVMVSIAIGIVYMPIQLMLALL